MSSSEISSSDLNRLTVKLFLVIATPVLFILTFLTGPFQVSDEPAHFLRAIAVSHGQFAPVISSSQDSAGGLVESSAAALAIKYGDTNKVALNNSYRFFPRDLIRSYNNYDLRKLIYAPFSNTAIYFPAAHLPQSAAILAAQFVGVKPLGWLYAGRLLNAGLFLIISCYAISILRGFEIFIITFLFLPMVAFEAASISADPLIISLSLLFCGLIKFLLAGTPPRSLEYGFFAICFVYIGLSKFAYIPICLLPVILVLLRGRLGAPLYILSIMTSAAILAWVAWVLAVHNDVFNMRGDGSYVNAGAQMHLMISHPGDFLSTLVRSIRIDRKVALETMVGSRLGWATVYNPGWVFKLSWILLVSSVFIRTEPFVGSIKTSFIILTFATLSFLMMYLLLYIQFTPVGKNHIDGMLGRYLLPLVVLLPVIHGGIVIKPERARILIYGFSVVSVIPLGVTMWTLLHRYWQL